ncbi:MAG: S41 family peptidase [Bacteroidetes bacterium]|nr:S41 family peptidase [Bacteroidota bacterium]
MKKTILLYAFVLCNLLVANAQPNWLRYSAISPDGKTVAFTYKGDLYRVPSSGGTAIPLTLHEAHDFMPVWSNDGKQIAFASDRFGNFDIFVIPAEGGEAKRLTYYSTAEYPYAFSNDNRSVIFGGNRLDAASNRNYPTGSQPELYQVSVTGGRVEQLISTPAEDVKLSKNGQYMLYHDKKGGETQWRKHHVSSITRDIWIYDFKSGKHKKITTFPGEDRTPVFTDNDKAFYYLSEESGSFNVHKMNIDGGKSTQISTFKKHPVRFLSMANNGTLCFSYDGELYTQQANGKPEKININITGDSKSNNERVVGVNGGARELAVSPNGKEVAYIFRGEVFVSAVEGGTTKRITNTPEQERSVSFSPDGKYLLYASERGNSWKIYQTEIVRKEEPYFYAATLIKETALVNNDKENYQPAYSPDGKEVAFIENHATLKVLNIATKQTRTILTDKELVNWGDNDQHFEWSPDGKWFAFSYAIEEASNSELGLISSDGKGKITNLTENGFNDGSPKWAMGGKMLLYETDRDGLRAKANSGGSQSDIYALFMNQESWDKFRLSKEEYALIKEQDEKNAKADTAKNKIKKDSIVNVELEGIVYRKQKLTINSSDLADALVSKDGETLYYLSKFEKGLNLWSTNTRTKETKILVPLNANSGSIEWDKDQKNIFLLSDGSISKIDVTTGKKDAVAMNGEMLLDIAAERRFMFEHVWRRTKTTFYTASFHGVDWDSYKPDYERHLADIGDNYEFSELLSELLGELNVSHCWSTYNNSNPNGDATASLGAFYKQNYNGNGIQIEELIKEGPLDKAGLNIKVGTIIESIDGEIITPNKDLAQYLNRKAGKNVLLTIADGNSKREIIVKPVSINEENRLLYKRFVRKNQEEVDRLSNGQLGYVHIPGMDDGSYRVVYEDIMGKYATRKGIVIDTRFNGGGDLVSDLAAFLTGKVFMVNATDNRIFSNEPTFRWTKPSIALVNEANYSDGHCFSYGYQNLEIGKLVGMPVPGTCTWAGWEQLQDASIRWGVPPVGVKNMKGRYLENSPTEPDIKVMNEFEIISKGKDQQLEAAINALLKELK